MLTLAGGAGQVSASGPTYRDDQEPSGAYRPSWIGATDLIPELLAPGPFGLGEVGQSIGAADAEELHGELPTAGHVDGLAAGLRVIGLGPFGPGVRVGAESGAGRLPESDSGVVVEVPMSWLRPEEARAAEQAVSSGRASGVDISGTMGSGGSSRLYWLSPG